jgi:DNA sulfur modification protein DndC
MLRRAGLFDAVEQAFRRNFYDNEDDAVERARSRRDALDTARSRASDEVFGSAELLESPELLLPLEVPK